MINSHKSKKKIFRLVSIPSFAVYPYNPHLFWSSLVKNAGSVCPNDHRGQHLAIRWQRCQKAADVFVVRAVGCGCHPGKLFGPKDDLMMFNDINDDINDDFYRWLMPKLVQWCNDAFHEWVTRDLEMMKIWVHLEDEPLMTQQASHGTFRQSNVALWHLRILPFINDVPIFSHENLYFSKKRLPLLSSSFIPI